jgi:hypothetical protein
VERKKEPVSNKQMLGSTRLSLEESGNETSINDWHDQKQEAQMVSTEHEITIRFNLNDSKSIWMEFLQSRI